MLGAFAYGSVAAILGLGYLVRVVAAGRGSLRWLVVLRIGAFRVLSVGRCIDFLRVVSDNMLKWGKKVNETF